MRITYFPNQVALNGAPVLESFLESCRRFNIKPVANNLDAECAVIWSMLWDGRMSPNQKIWEYYRKTNRPVVVLEVGGLKRNLTWRVGLNGVNGAALFGPNGQNSDRANQLGLHLAPWRTSGKNIVICLQRHESHQWENMPKINLWVSQTINQIKKHSDRPIVIRRHPRQTITINQPGVTVQSPNKIADTYDDFDFDRALLDAWAVINWSSNPGMQSIIAGVPAFVGPESLAAPVANLDLSQIETPSMPDRQQWLNDLSYCEWTLDEIAKGFPLERLMITEPMKAAIEPR